MNCKRFISCGLITLIVCGIITTGGWAQDYDYIDITNPFLRKSPIAIPVFKSITDTPEERQISKQAADLLASSLEFTGYFKLIDRKAFLVDPQTAGIIAPNINFQNWTAVGAELLVTGGVLSRDGGIELELRLFDTFKMRLLVGKRYKGRSTDQRQMIHRFCSEVIYRLTGNWGIFDSKIAFISTGTGSKEIFVSEFDGYNPKRLTHHKSISLSPDWSRDGHWIAYTSYVKGKPDLYIKHLKEKRGSIVAKKGINITPAWVPGEFSLAATLSFSGDPEIYLLTGTGKIIKKLTSSWGIDVSPTWSSDGKKMAFVSNRSGGPQIYIFNRDTAVVERLTFEGRYNTSPAWSPVGNKIAYGSLNGGQFDIYTIDTDGGDPTQLTFDPSDEETPSWAPDGSMIAYSSTREGPKRIYVMTAFGTDQRRLLTLKGQQTSPKWSPRFTK
ncbi:MAG: Tol-Pal system beta propeller repeat protein TolB [Desulfobacterales bacterium]|nr:Tol-Pal system beta propeller repeat protein TolB [Desulfobacterales bacterium]